MTCDTRKQFDSAVLTLKTAIRLAGPSKGSVVIPFEVAEALEDAIWSMDRHLPDFFEDEDDDEDDTTDYQLVAWLAEEDEYRQSLTADAEDE